MKKHIILDKKKRQSFLKKEPQHLFIKSLFFNITVTKRELKIAYNFLYDLNIKLTEINNFCILTGRSNSIYSLFKLSRMQIRVLNHFQYLPGLKKAS